MTFISNLIKITLWIVWSSITKRATVAVQCLTGGMEFNKSQNTQSFSLLVGLKLNENIENWFVYFWNNMQKAGFFLNSRTDKISENDNYYFDLLR